MSEEKFYLLESADKRLRCSVHFKRVEIGAILIVEMLPMTHKNYEILLTDVTGENIYNRITESTAVINLGRDFSISGKILFDLFSGGKPLISASLDSDVYYSETNFTIKQEPITEEDLAEAEEFINRVKPCEENLNIYKDIKAAENDLLENILKDFNYLYDRGESDFKLSLRFKGTEWVKLELGEEDYYLGKIIDEGGGIILALPKLSSKQNPNELGSRAEFVKATMYDDFGYLVLAQNMATGKAIKII